MSGANWAPLLSRLTLEVTDAALTKVPSTWRTDDQVPMFHRLYFILEGSGRVVVNGQAFEPGPSDLVLLPAGARISFQTAGVDTYLKYWCHFTAKVGGIDLLTSLRLPVVVRPIDAGPLVDRFRGLIAARNRSGLSAAFQVQAAVLELIAGFLEAAGLGEALPWKGDGHRRLEPILEYIDAHLAEPLKLDELADFAHLQKNYFVSVFRADMGLSPMRYVHLCRMDRARALLRSPDLGVSAVGELVGIPDPFRFSKDFRASSGFSPSEYRKLVMGTGGTSDSPR